MDLALQMGVPARSLARHLTEAEFQDWRVYAARRMLPQRRLELYLAQIAMLVAKSGRIAKNGATLDDYLFDPPDIEGDDEPTADEEIAFFDFNPERG